MRLVFNGIDIGETTPYIITGYKSSVLGKMKLSTYDIPQSSAVQLVSNYAKGILMEIDMSIMASTHEALLGHIRTLQNALYPQANTPIDITIYTDNNDPYQVNAYLVSDLDFSRKISYGEVSFSLLIPSGQIKGNSLQSQTLAQSGVGSGVIVPFTLPVLLGSITGGATVNNAGTAYANTNITITGPGLNFTILNQTTGESMAIDGLTLSSSQSIIINGDEFTIKQGNVSIYQYVTAESTFLRLKPGMNNILLYVATGATAGTSATITWYNTYVAI